jgi:hypothetical protein
MLITYYINYGRLGTQDRTHKPDLYQYVLPQVTQVLKQSNLILLEFTPEARQPLLLLSCPLSLCRLPHAYKWNS